MTGAGYGVEAVLKNMEYSAIDDKKKDATATASTVAADEVDDAALGEVKGFRWAGGAVRSAFVGSVAGVVWSGDLGGVRAP